MSNPLSQSSAYPDTAPICSLPTLWISFNAAPISSFHLDTPAAVEIILTSPDRHVNKPAGKESIRDDRLSSYNEGEENEIKRYMSQHFEADNI